MVCGGEAATEELVAVVFVRSARIRATIIVFKALIPQDRVGTKVCRTRLVSTTHFLEHFAFQFAKETRQVLLLVVRV
jgi:hypothetical protein